MKPDDIKSFNDRPRRVEGGGFIRWYMNDKCVVEVTTDAYYRKGHVHPEDCQCDALVHDESFRAKLREHGFG